MSAPTGAPAPGPGLVEAALDSLQHGRSRGTHVSTSDLSVDEAVLLAEVGYEPRELVMGSSVYHAGYSFTNAAGGELTQLSQAMHAARERAMSRMANDARKAGAEGVVGVRLSISDFEARRHLLEFTAIGTAVGRTGEGQGRRRNEHFFTSDLSGQEFYLLRRAGWQPVGLVLGCCVYQMAWQGVFGQAGQGNVEITAATGALYEARERAMGRLQDEALHLGAHGVIGMRLSESAHTWGSRAIEFLAIGTAVTLVEAEHRLIAPEPVVALEDVVVATDPGTLRGEGGGEGPGDD